MKTITEDNADLPSATEGQPTTTDKKQKAMKKKSSSKKKKKKSSSTTSLDPEATESTSPTDTFEPIVPSVASSSPRARNTANSPAMQRRLSSVSKMYDVNNKGYLDEEEGILRTYDANNDGKIDIHEMKQIVSDLRHQEKKQFRWRRYSLVAVVLLALSVLCNFAMVWVALALTRQIETQDGQLVDTQGNLLSVKAQGSHLDVQPNKEYSRRLLAFKAQRLGRSLSEEDHEEFRRLMEDVPVATASCESVSVMWTNSENGIPTSVSVTTDNGDSTTTTYSGLVGSGVTHTTDGACDTYDGIVEVGQTGPTYKVTCCCDDEATDGTCDIFDLDSNGERRLCFAPLTVVDVEGTGPTFLKDVQPGQKVLAQGGKYQELYAFSMYSTTEKSEFLQLTTSKTILELAEDHMIYLYGKSDPVQAGVVQVGDMLIGQDEEPLQVMKIQNVVREGFVHGLTADGTIVADGVLASVHVSKLGSQEYLIDAWGLQFIHAQTVERFTERPFRRLCTEISTDFCNQFASKDLDKDITRALWERIGYTWQFVLAERYNIPFAVNFAVSIFMVFYFNFLATPSLVIALLMIWLSKKRNSIVKEV